MGRIRIEGGIPLDGEVRIQGSKNAALPIMAAALLNRGTTVLKGCPRIADVFLMERMLKGLGAKTSWQEDTLEICARELKSCTADRELGEKMRSSIVLMGSLLGRYGEGILPFPGGCVIGARKRMSLGTDQGAAWRRDLFSQVQRGSYPECSAGSSMRQRNYCDPGLFHRTGGKLAVPFPEPGRRKDPGNRHLMSCDPRGIRSS